VAVIEDIAKASWRPELEGWSEDILPYYRSIFPTLPAGAVVVEVGVAHGRSVVFLAEELERAGRHDVEIWCVDSWGGAWFRESIVPTLNRSEIAGYVDRLRIVRCEERRAAKLFDKESIDLAFIDSDHSEEGVTRSIVAWYSKVKAGGILAGHDYSREDWPGVVAAVDKFTGKLVDAVDFSRPTRSVWQWLIR
jgi:cephalosporin hydroxylase